MWSPIDNAVTNQSNSVGFLVTFNLFTCILTNDGKATLMVICSDYEGKDKGVTGIFLNLLHKKYIPSNDAVQEEIIWSDGPTSELKVF